MYETWLISNQYYSGLGESLRPDYVMNGSKVYYNAIVWVASGAIQNKQFRDAADSAIMKIRAAGFLVYGQSYNEDAGNFHVNLEVPIDMNSINDVKSICDSIVFEKFGMLRASMVRFLFDAKVPKPPTPPPPGGWGVDPKAGQTDTGAGKPAPSGSVIDSIGGMFGGVGSMFGVSGMTFAIGALIAVVLLRK